LVTCSLLSSTGHWTNSWSCLYMSVMSVPLHIFQDRNIVVPAWLSARRYRLDQQSVKWPVDDSKKHLANLYSISSLMSLHDSSVGQLSGGLAWSEADFFSLKRHWIRDKLPHNVQQCTLVSWPKVLQIFTLSSSKLSIKVGRRGVRSTDGLRTPWPSSWSVFSIKSRPSSAPVSIWIWPKIIG